MLEKVDLFLLNKFEKLGHRFQLLTGKTNFFLAMICSLVFIAFLMIFCLINKLKPTTLDLIFYLIIGSRIITYRTDENNALKRITKGYFNARKINPLEKMLRKCLIIWALVSSITETWLSFLMLLCLLLQVYLDACDPLPPCRGKIGEMVDAFFAPKLVPIPIKESDK